MAIFGRRAGSALVRLIRQAAAPGAVAGQTQLYSLPGIGVGEPSALYARGSSGIENKLAGIRAKLPTSYVDGAGLSWTTVAQVTIAPGFVRSADDTFDLYLAANQVVDIAVGGLNGLDTGAEAASTWYSVWLVGDSTGANPVGGILSASFAAPTLPAGYDKYCRIGCVRNSAGSNFLKFWQVGSNTFNRRYYYDEDRATVQVLTNGASLAYAAVSLATRIPPTSQNVILSVSFLAPAVGGAVTDLLALRPTGANSADGPYEFRAGLVATAALLVQCEMPTSAAQSIDYKVSDADDLANLFVLGFDDDLS